MAAASNIQYLRYTKCQALKSMTQIKSTFETFGNEPAKEEKIKGWHSDRDDVKEGNNTFSVMCAVILEVAPENHGFQSLKESAIYVGTLMHNVLHNLYLEALRILKQCMAVYRLLNKEMGEGTKENRE